ncbi:MAG: class II aldolase/adducin family protein [Burkholderiaceae bacterium]
MDASDTPESLDGLCPDGMALDEWRLRLELAACYRLFDHLGWTELIYNHITLRVPGGDPANPHFLINPFGLHYSEVTASNLVKIDRAGNKIDASPWPVNPAGFTIHSTVHGARDDAHCVMHTHTTAGMAIACKRDGLRYDNFYSALLYGLVGYHDFEGVTTNPGEAPRLVASLARNEMLILRNHGLLALGAGVPEAFDRLWTLQRACEVQLAADSMQGDNVTIPNAVLERNAEAAHRMNMGPRRGRMPFEGIRRRAAIRFADLV